MAAMTAISKKTFNVFKKIFININAAMTSAAISKTVFINSPLGTEAALAHRWLIIS